MITVIVIAGTIDARQIIEELLKLDAKVVATVTTTFGAGLISDNKRLEVREGKLTSVEMAQLINVTGAKCVVDASHPYASEASKNAIEACKISGVEYIRFERDEVGLGTANLLHVKDFEEAAVAVSQMKGNIFLTVGSNNLETFVKHLPDFRDRLFVRVLPDSKVLLKCTELGLGAKNIFALLGPFSEKMNLEMYKHCSASIIVTKDSGEAGGTIEKITAAEKLGIQVVLVERPKVDYNNRVSSIQGVVDYVSGLL